MFKFSGSKREETQVLKAVVLDEVDVLEQGVAPILAVESATTPNCPPQTNPGQTCP